MRPELSEQDFRQFYNLFSVGDLSKIPGFVDQLVQKLSNGTHVNVTEVLRDLVENTLPIDSNEVAGIIEGLRKGIADFEAVQENPLVENNLPIESSDAPSTKNSIIPRDKFYADVQTIATAYGIPVRGIDAEVFPVSEENKRTIVRSETPTKTRLNQSNFINSVKTKFELVLKHLIDANVDLNGADISISKRPVNSLRIHPYAILTIPAIDMAIFISVDEATYLLLGIKDFSEIISTDKTELKAKYPKQIKKFKFDSINPKNYLKKISLKLTPKLYLDQVIPALMAKYPTRDKFINMPYSERSELYASLNLDEIAQLFVDFDQKLKPIGKNSDLSILADHIYGLNYSTAVPPDKMTAHQWINKLKSHFKTGAKMIATTKRTELKINGWDLNQIAVVVLGDRRRSMLEKYPKFVPMKIDKHLAYLAREVFGTEVPEIESYFWTNQELAAKFQQLNPDRTIIENLHWTEKQTFNFYGLSLYALYSRVFGNNSNPAANKQKLSELLDKLYATIPTPVEPVNSVESIAT